MINRPTADPPWRELSRAAGVASHRLIGWIYWDPGAIERYAALGAPPFSYYVATRAAPLAAAGNDVVTAAFYSIRADFVALSLDACRATTTFEQAAGARDEGVVAGLHAYVPEIADGLAALAEPLWEAADALVLSGRPLYAAHRAWPRPDDPLLSAWLAVNCIREWRGDTHWALHAADDIGPIEAGVLDGGWRHYDEDWLPRSRGADDEALAAAYAELERRGLADGRRVNRRGVAHRQHLEDRLDDLAAAAWRNLGEARTRELIELIEPVGGRLLERIDLTAGPKWMPAGRERVPE